jgi:membrane associated rhomboid family serine protease
MKSFSIKFKSIFLPFIIIAVCTVCGYTFINWLLIIKLHLFEVDEDWLNFFIPGALSIIPVFIFLRPRLKLLKFKKKGDPLGAMIMLLWVTVAVPTLLAQAYLEVASGTLTTLDRISQINQFPQSRYYKVRHFYIDTSRAGVKTTFEVSGKYNENFDMGIYTASPVFDEKPAGPVRRPMNLPDSIKRALIVVNGQKLAVDNLAYLDPANIKSIDIIKSKAAIALFGKEAEQGAMLIKTKKPVNLNTMGLQAYQTPQKPIAWITLRFSKTISNKLEPNEKEERFKVFARESQQEFNAKKLDDFVYLDRIGLSKEEKNYAAAVKSRDSITANPIILKPVNEPFEARLGQKLPWVFGSFGIGTCVFLIALLFIPLKEFVNVDFKEAPEEPASGWEDFRNIFFPRKGYYFTPIIIDLNLLIYIIMVCCGLGFISFDGNDLLKWGANFRPAVQNGEYWRLLTSVFLHGGLMHILFNMYGLMFVGIFLEPLMGSTRYLIAYLFTGILASLASVWWHPATIGVGASGAIFGMYGIFLALLTTNLFPHDFKKSFLVSTGIFVGYNLLFGLTGGIDNAAHIGGLISGLLIGYALYPSLKKRAREIDAEAETQELLEELTGKTEE